MDPKNSLFSLLFISLICCASNTSKASPLHSIAKQDTSFSKLYEKGLKLRDEQPMEALKIWFKAKNFAKSPDPRIGMVFLQTVVVDSLIDYYGEASRMYYWGLSGSAVEPYTDQLHAELERLEPIMNRDLYDRLEKLLEDNNPRFFKRLMIFWKSHDPIPSTPENEYLITIWERIKYAQAHFKKGSYSAYGTDARGPVYVKYGKPDNLYGEQNANLNVKTSDNGNILNMITEQLTGQKTSLKTARFKLDGESPDIQFWIYNPGTVHINRDVIYMFGTIPKKQQQYNIIESLDELIPKSLVRNPGGGFNKAYLQFRRRLYREYRTINPYFHHEYMEMVNILQGNAATAVGNTRTFASLSRNRTTAELEGRKAEAEPVMGNKNIPDFPSNISTYQFYNEQGMPYSVAALYSYPQKLLAANKYNEAVTGSSSKKVISHTLQYINDEQDTVITYKDVPGMELSANVKGNNSLPAISFYKLEDVPAQTRLHSTAEIISYKKRKQTTDQVSFLGVHSETKKLDKQDSNSNWFLSDAVIGYNNKEVKIHDSRFPFYPSPDKRIPKGKNLRIYFELYDFSDSNDASNAYQLSYSIKSKKGFFADIFGKDSDQKVTIKADPFERVDTNSVEIKTRELPAGDYILNIIIASSAHDNIEKEISFDIF